ncbi:hypothetical protein BOTCAL_0052g00220 [Botryotinia calthae]|uniref:Uncharacterized protein n=1 Tax=Botryotinia calthae TaxID=38488 RepID=A0A4Y8DD88_9HELO|nr:hypothetical protein BOTCAL_0052g00220 [Botryotinia calthae]
MEEPHLFSALKTRILDLEKQLKEKEDLLKVANSNVEKLQETVSVQKQTINERDSTILSIQNLEAWNEGACEATGLQLNWQEGWKKLWSIISAQDQLIAQKDEIIAERDLTIRKKDLTITEKDLLLSIADPNAFPLNADVKVACLGGLRYEKDGAFAYIDLNFSVKQVQVDVKGRTINGCVISFLIDQINRLHESYNNVNAASLKIRAREMENAIASRTGSVPREKITGPGNHAAHGADAFADVQMVLETDSKTDAGRVISGKREQFKITYLVPPETVIKFGSVWNDSYSPEFIQLLNIYQDLKIWNNEGIGQVEFCTRRYRVRRPVSRVYHLEELPSTEAFDTNEAAIKEFNQLLDISRELQDEHRKFRRENKTLSRKDSGRRSLEETSLGANVLRRAISNSSFSITRRDLRGSLK